MSLISVKVLFPVLLIGLDLAASAVYGFYGDWKHCVYWAAAATLTICVTL